MVTVLAAASPSRPSAVPASGVGQLRIAIDSEPDLTNLKRTAERHDYVVLASWQVDAARALKEANPDLRVLAYKNLSASIETSVRGHFSTGVSLAQARRHRGWFLKSRRGRRFTFDDYEYLWAMDVGSASYARRWARNVIDDLRGGPWDGVVMDDTNTTMRHHFPVSKAAKYPTDEAWQQATRRALRRIAPRIRAKGLSVIPNFGDWSRSPEIVASWLAFVDGGIEEHFLKATNAPDLGYATGPLWAQQMDILRATLAAGKEFLGVAHSADGDADAARYGWASMLLAGQGSAYFGLHDSYDRENWFDFYDYQLGAPAGPSTAEESGVQRREFAHGLALVNPTDSAQEVEFGGPYSGSGLLPATSATMAPHSGLVLESVL